MSVDLEILVFAKAPEAGRVKTRLIPELGSKGAAELYETLLRQQMEQLSALQEGVSITYWCAPNPQHDAFSYAAEKFGYRLKQQPEGDLGFRMNLAAQDGLTRASAVVLIGVDCPAMTNDYLKQALILLSQGTPVVIGPAEDGGYVLLGLRQVEKQLFSDMEWGVSSVLIETLKRLNALGWNYQLLPELWDLDRPQDLLRYQEMKRCFSNAG